LSGFVIGGVVALVTAWAASIYIGRLNIIRAIRDQPEPVLPRRRSRSLALGVLGILAGGATLVAGVAYDNWLGTLIGIPLAAVAAIPLLAGSIGRRAAASWACGLTIVWGVVCFSVVPQAFEGSGIPTFVAEGILLVAAAVGLGAINADAIGRLVAKLAGPGRNLSARLGFAYPVARRFRTSMLLGMYALIVFVLTFLAVFSKLYDQQAPDFIRQSSAGYEVVVDSNETNPATINTLFGKPGVATVAPIVRGVAKFSSPQHPKLTNWPMSGFDKSFIQKGQPQLSARLDRFATDKDAWNGVYDNKDLVIVSDFFLEEGTGPRESRINVGDQILAVNPTTNERRTLTVAGILKSDLLDQGVVAGAPMARTFLGAAAVSNRHFVAVKPDADPEEVSQALTAELVQFGVDADTIAAIVRLQLQEQQGFIRLMQGYLVLGLLVGIAGLGVVMVRAVRERRRQIGMLRAMGFSRGVVRRAFMVEAGFVAVQGIVVGVLLALAGLLVVALLGSLAATAAPAAQAARIAPAVALRTAE
ncbi:MAG: ABC transporter permease, partial [Acidimicrobiales bacterium]